MTTRALYKLFLQELQSLYSLNEATIITDWTFESLAGLQKADFIKTPGQEPPRHIQLQLSSALADLLESKPVQYVLGEAYFFKMKLRVNEHVLIPRPETEELVQLVIDEGPGAGLLAGSSILDIGTGSGCIPVALKQHLSHTSITAIDISEDALELARKNARDQNTEIRFVPMDFLDESQWPSLQRFNVIVSNPPYIPLNEKEKLEKNVTAYEPATALFVPANDPLLFYRKIACFGKTNLLPGGKIFVEIHEDFANDVIELFQQTYDRADLRNDVYGKPRIVILSGAR